MRNVRTRSSRGGPDNGQAPAVETRLTLRRILRLSAAFLLVNALFLPPVWILDGWVGSRWLVLEAVFLVALFALLPANRWNRIFATAGGVAVVLLAVLIAADTTLLLSLGRPLNLLLDLGIAPSVHHLLAGMLGESMGIAALIGAGLGAIGIAVALALLLNAPDRTPPPGNRVGRWAAGIAMCAFLAPLLAFGDRVPVIGPRTAAPAVHVAAQQASQLRDLLGERERFAAEATATAASLEGIVDPLGSLGDKDVLLAFIESYGISALDDPRYAPVLQPRLDDMEARMSAAGLHVVTGTLASPTRGGQSWLAHGTMLSGLWLDSQLRYDLLVATGRRTLIDDFRAVGHRTAAVMPAITLAWPEGERFGYDEIFAFDRMEYAGPPLNWVTMPDQYTWSFLERRVRAGGSDRPLFAVIGLISSHAPWTPILPVLDDWDGIGGGSVFAGWADAGERPEELWREPDRVRDHFALSVDYAVHAMVAYAERYVDERVLLIALGDHQPAPLITGDGAAPDVPVHVISGDPTLLAPFLDLGFRPGARPHPGLEPPGMDEFRGWFVAAFAGAKTREDGR